MYHDAFPTLTQEQLEQQREGEQEEEEGGQGVEEVQDEKVVRWVMCRSTMSRVLSPV